MEWFATELGFESPYLENDRIHSYKLKPEVESAYEQACFLRYEIEAEWREAAAERHRELFERGFPWDESRSWWEADHIVPVVEGGGQCGLENYRTLCVPCHKRVTAELAARRAAARRAARENASDQIPLIELSTP